MLHKLLCFVALVLCNSLPSDFLGLSRDFFFDVTVQDKDRLSFSSQGSGVQQFTFYSEGDLSDNMAFYLYGTWTWAINENHWTSHNDSDARFHLVKTRNKLPVERYDVTNIIKTSQEDHLNRQERNIMQNLARLCEPLHNFMQVLRAERSQPFTNHANLDANINMLTPEIPLIFRGIFAKTLESFGSTMEAEFSSIIPAPRGNRPVHLQPPEDFNYTWQQEGAESRVETLALNYDRGKFRVIIDSAQESFKSILKSLGL